MNGSVMYCVVLCCVVLCCVVLCCCCREEESLVDMFVIEMLVVLIHSLKMAHRDEKALGEFSTCSFLYIYHKHDTENTCIKGCSTISVRRTLLCGTPGNSM